MIESNKQRIEVRPSSGLTPPTTDYRQPSARRFYFEALYEMNLRYGVMPGLVYLYLPQLRKRLEWSEEEALWFAFINGNTQNPITSLIIFNRLEPPPHNAGSLTRFREWFSLSWNTLQFDTDRRHQKRDFIASVERYASLVRATGSQSALMRHRSFEDAWSLVRDQFYSFGRLSAWSYLEFLNILDGASSPTTMMFDDVSGSKSHRNGMLFLLGMDGLVHDKRCRNDFNGKYENFTRLCSILEQSATGFLNEFRERVPMNAHHVNRFTLESQLCQFKNGFFERRYPGVYADMAWDRICWSEQRGNRLITDIFKDIRAECLPSWLRMETQVNPIPRQTAASMFVATGQPYRAEHFL